MMEILKRAAEHAKIKECEFQKRFPLTCSIDLFVIDKGIKVILKVGIGPGKYNIVPWEEIEDGNINILQFIIDKMFDSSIDLCEEVSNVVVR